MKHTKTISFLAALCLTLGSGLGFASVDCSMARNKNSCPSDTRWSVSKCACENDAGDLVYVVDGHVVIIPWDDPVIIVDGDVYEPVPEEQAKEYPKGSNVRGYYWNERIR